VDPRGERLCAQLREAAQRLAEWRRLDGELKALDAEIARHDAHDDRVRRRAGRSAQELERLGGFGVRALLLRLTGRASRLRAAAEARLAEARTEQQACESAMAPLQQQRAGLAAQQAKVAGARQEHAEALAGKEQWLRDCRHATVAQLDAVRERLDVVAKNRSALTSALGAARLATMSVQAAIEQVSAARSPGRLRHMDIAVNLAMNMVEKRSRAAQADAHVAHAMQSVQVLADAVGEVRALGVVQLDGLASPDQLFAGESVDLTQTLARVRELVWALERSDTALAELHHALDAERITCIEAAS
jgi:hypothetical protein